MKPKKRKKLKQYNTFIAVHFLNRHQVFLNYYIKHSSKYVNSFYLFSFLYTLKLKTKVIID